MGRSVLECDGGDLPEPAVRSDSDRHGVSRLAIACPKICTMHHAHDMRDTARLDARADDGARGNDPCGARILAWRRSCRLKRGSKETREGEAQLGEGEQN